MFFIVNTLFLLVDGVQTFNLGGLKNVVAWELSIDTVFRIEAARLQQQLGNGAFADITGSAISTNASSRTYVSSEFPRVAGNIFRVYISKQFVNSSGSQLYVVEVRFALEGTASRAHIHLILEYLLQVFNVSSKCRPQHEHARAHTHKHTNTYST